MSWLLLQQESLGTQNHQGTVELLSIQPGETQATTIERTNARITKMNWLYHDTRKVTSLADLEDRRVPSLPMPQNARMRCVRTWNDPRRNVKEALPYWVRNRQNKSKRTDELRKSWWSYERDDDDVIHARPVYVQFPTMLVLTAVWTQTDPG